MDAKGSGICYGESNWNGYLGKFSRKYKKKVITNECIRTIMRILLTITDGISSKQFMCFGRAPNFKTNTKVATER